jgi:hypothetical protein
MSDKIIVDLSKFRNLKSCISAFKLDNSYCSQGKFCLATGAINSCDSDDLAASKCKKVLWQALSGFSMDSLNTVAWTNNSGEFEEADNLMLRLAIESGKYEFINALPEDEVKIRELENAM